MTIQYNDYVKRPDLSIEYSLEMLEELDKCSKDFYAFLKHVKIVHPDKGRVIFEPRPYQREILDAMLNEKYILACCSRQSGKTTSVAAFVMWYACFNKDKYIAIGSNSAKSAQDFLYRIQIMYEELPPWLKPGVTTYNKLSLILENGTSINSSATSKNSFRGRSVSLLILDEFAHLLSDKLADEFFEATFPAIAEAKESKLAILSTPKGMTNLFARLYKDAENGYNNFKHFKVSWELVPGRDEKWKEEQLKAMGGDITKFNQEFGADFISSSQTVIDPECLRRIINNYTMPVTTELNNKLLIWEQPRADGRYILGIDPSKGTGGHDAAMQILKIESLKPLKLIQVAVFSDNKTDLYELAEIAGRAGLHYNTALIMVENNAEGYSCAQQLHYTHEYPNLFCTKADGRSISAKIKDLGVRANRVTKAKAVLFMKRVIEDGSLILKDRTTLEQLTDFQELRPNIFKCENVNDDLISALYWATYAATLNILESDIQLNKRSIEDEVWGILSDVVESDDWEWINAGYGIGVG
jgi:hypothetical protein